MKLFVAFFLALMVACGGGGSSSPTPTKTYGIFRATNPKVVIANQIMQPMVATSGNMVVPRFGHSSTLLQDGRVLIAGGQSKAEDSIFPNQSTYLSSLEIFDPVTETFTLSNATLTSPRSNQAAVLMGNGQVLFIGGGASADMETYDPVTDVCTWRNTIFFSPEPLPMTLETIKF